MALNVDTHRIFRAIQAAGLDPRNEQQFDQFTNHLVDLVKGLPAERQTKLTQSDWNRLADQAASQIAQTRGMEQLREQGRDKDPSALFALSDLGAGGKARQAVTRGSAEDAGIDPTTTRDSTTLWNEARRQGKI